MFLPTEQSGAYSYWIYECPESAAFSARQAVISLRRAAERGTVPWGTITLDPAEAILDTAIKAVIREEINLPSKIPEKAFKLVLQNLSTTRLHQLYLDGIPSAKGVYSEAS